MPNLPISQLPALTAITQDAEFAVAQSGVTYRVKAGNISSGIAYGSFLSTDVQSATSITSAYSMSADTTTVSNGVTVVDGCKFTVVTGGTYNIQFSTQVESTKGGSPETIDIWLSKNGTNVDASNTQLSLNSNNGKTFAAWNFVETLNSGGYFELKWAVSDTQIQLVTLGTQVNPTRPSVPSVIVTVTQI